MFNAHSRITSPPESHIWERFVRAPRKDAIQAMQSLPQLETYLDQHDKVQRLGIPAHEALLPFTQGNQPFDALQMYRHYLELYAAKKQKTVLVEGSPTNILDADLLLSKFPESYIIHIIRDPRDVILSTLRADFTKGFLVTIAGLAEKYMEYYVEGTQKARQVYGERYIRVYYEDLCTHPQRELEKICAGIHETFEPAMMEYFKQAGEVFSKDEMQWKKNLLKGVMNTNFGKWKKEMDPADVLLVDYICKDFFRKEKSYELSEYTRKWNPIKKQLYLMPYKMRKLRDKIRGRDWKKPKSPKG
jgi:hypothetical protein